MSVTLAAGRQIPLPLSTEDLPDFGHFVAGPNTEACIALEGLLASDEASSVYLWGAAGTGKTHLLQALCRQAGEQGREVAWVPMAELEGLSAGVLEGLREVGLVCLDGLDAIAGAGDWEQAVFHLFNHLRDSGRRLVVSARVPPRQLPLSLPDLHSRLSWGLVFHLYEMDDAAKARVLRTRADARGFALPAEVAEYLVRRCPRDMHSLLAVLERLDRGSLAAQRRLSIPFVKQLLGL